MRWLSPRIEQAILAPLLGFAGIGCGRDVGQEGTKPPSLTQSAPVSAAPVQDAPGTSTRLGPLGVEAPESATQVRSDELPTIELPPHSPDIPPQLLTCDSKGFGRLTASGFEYYSTLDLERIAALEIPRTHNAIRLFGASVLIVSRQNVYRYYHGQKKAVKFTRIPLLGPLQLWPDAQNVDAFWVRYLRDPELHRYDLRSVEGGEPSREELETLSAQTVTVGESKPLPNFDGRRFALLSDGVPFYSTPDAFVYASRRLPRRIPLTRFASPVAGILPTPRLDRIWLLTEAGEAQLLELSRGLPERERARFEGTPVGFDATHVLAVVSAGFDAPSSYRLQVYGKQQRIFDVPLPPLTAGNGTTAREIDNRSVCLFPDRPWVLAGGRQLLQVFDYVKGTLLFQRLAE